MGRPISSTRIDPHLLQFYNNQLPWVACIYQLINKKRLSFCLQLVLLLLLFLSLLLILSFILEILLPPSPSLFLPSVVNAVTFCFLVMLFFVIAYVPFCLLVMFLFVCQLCSFLFANYVPFCKLFPLLEMAAYKATCHKHNKFCYLALDCDVK